MQFKARIPLWYGAALDGHHAKFQSLGRAKRFHGKTCLDKSEFCRSLQRLSDLCINNPFTSVASIKKSPDKQINPKL